MDQMGHVILGKDSEIRLAVICILARGHLLIEDLPGMGKTTFVMALAKVLGLTFGRIQFTNDLLPSDILGGNLFDTKSGSLVFHKGPIFNQVLLADELNRASAKTQSAFLQAMEERQITVDGQVYDLPDHFYVMATQNPLSTIGTNPLPESQLDRFLMRLTLGYPDAASERKILSEKNPREKIGGLKMSVSPQALAEVQNQIQNIHVSDVLISYVQRLMVASRQKSIGLSPRAGIQMISAARAAAFVDGREMVLPDDVQMLAPNVWGHRLGNEGASVIQEVIRSVSVTES